MSVIFTTNGNGAYPSQSRVSLKCFELVPGGRGYTKDVCGCCDVCAKGRGELCGGYWFHFGRCDADLTCVLRTNGKLINTGLGQRILPGRCEDGKGFYARAPLDCSLKMRTDNIDDENDNNIRDL